MKKYLIYVIVACILLLFLFAGQGKSYDKAITSEDTVTYSLNGNINTDRLIKFINNVEDGKIDRINLVRYTTEGDPLITQLYFNGVDIKVAIDNSQDKFGGQDKNRITYKTIKGKNKLVDNLMKYLSNNHF